MTINELTRDAAPMNEDVDNDTSKIAEFILGKLPRGADGSIDPEGAGALVAQKFKDLGMAAQVFDDKTPEERVGHVLASTILDLSKLATDHPEALGLVNSPMLRMVKGFVLNTPLPEAFSGFLAKNLKFSK